MPKIFISYRHEDSEDVSGRIFDHLAAHFGKPNLFMDIDAIPFGVDFRKHIADAVGQCDVILAVIGKEWLEARHREGPKQDQRRLDDPADFVRIEIQTGLERDIRVIPVLVGGASMPGEQHLPDVLKPLAFRNAAEVRSGRDFHDHMERLIQGIEGQVKSEESAVSNRSEAARKANENRGAKGRSEAAQKAWETRRAAAADGQSVIQVLEKVQDMLTVAASACNMTAKKIRGKEYLTVKLDGKYYASIYFKEPKTLSFVTACEIDPLAAARLNTGEVWQENWVPGRNRWGRNADLDPESVQLDWLIKFLSECLAQARSIETKDQPTIPKA